jgi:DNA topoisomerase-3
MASKIDQLLIADKPDLAQAIASGLGTPKNGSGYIEVGSKVVTWCYGHLPELAPPHKYGFQQWRIDTLPIIPKEWIFNGWDRKIKAQIKTIEQLVAKASEIVHAGDPDREGQLLVDEILDHLGVRKPVKRIWLSATDAQSVKKALASLEDNRKYRSLRDAALARSKADWLVGINLSRALTLRARQQTGQRDVLLPVGRVQTPTLALVVARDREIEEFVPRTYFVPWVRLRHDKGEFVAYYSGTHSAVSAGVDDSGLDEKGRLVDEDRASKLGNIAEGTTGELSSVSETDRRKKPDPPHMLSSLQKEAHSRHGIDTGRTLKIVQGLYERGVVSYPRTDCRYLPEEQLGAAPQILASLQGMGVGAESADSGIKSAAWNTSKVEAHHAIIPTGQGHGNLSGEEQKVFEVIARGYVRQFYPDMRYVEQKAVASLAGSSWKATGKVITEPGWTVVDGGPSRTTELPRGMKQQDPVECAGAGYEQKKTSPPSRFTKASLLEAMSQIHLYCQQKSLRKKLKENSGLGTEATRTSIIEGLVKRKLLQQKGKQLLSTELGRKVVDSVPFGVRDPGTTALWEEDIGAIAKGESSESKFLQMQEQFVAKLTQMVQETELPFQPGESASQSDGGENSQGRRKSGSDPDSESGTSVSPDQTSGSGRQSGANSGSGMMRCPVCGEQSLKRLKNKQGGYYWGCFNKQAHAEEKPVFRSDVGGKPGSRPTGGKPAECPKCGEKSLYRRKNRKGTWYWGCFNTEKHSDGGPVFRQDKTGEEK